MMTNVKTVLMILALICFLLAGIGIGWTRGNLIGAGLFFLTFGLMIT